MARLAHTLSILTERKIGSGWLRSMIEVRDEELVELIAAALQRSGPDGNPERVSAEFAAIRAAAVVRALRRASITTMREHARRRGDQAAATSSPARAGPSAIPKTDGGCQILPMKRRTHAASR
jgi:hypothetical protein